MSLVTKVMLGNADNECARLGSDAMLAGAGEEPGAREVEVFADGFIAQSSREGCARKGDHEDDGAEEREVAEEMEKPEERVDGAAEVDIGTGQTGISGGKAWVRVGLGGVEGFETNKGPWCADGRGSYAKTPRAHSHCRKRTLSMGHANREGEEPELGERRSPPRTPATEDARRHFHGFAQPDMSILAPRADLAGICPQRAIE